MHIEETAVRSRQRTRRRNTFARPSFAVVYRGRCEHDRTSSRAAVRFSLEVADCFQSTSPERSLKTELQERKLTTLAL